jgi:hypothetical protein
MPIHPEERERDLMRARQRARGGGFSEKQCEACRGTGAAPVADTGNLTGLEVLDPCPVCLGYGSRCDETTRPLDTLELLQRP